MPVKGQKSHKGDNVLMRVKEGYNAWASTYDTDANLTRDLDRTVTRRLFEQAKRA